MKGTILDFLKLAAEKPELAKELVELAGRYEFEFTDEVSDEELEAVAGGIEYKPLTDEERNKLQNEQTEQLKPWTDYMQAVYEQQKAILQNLRA